MFVFFFALFVVSEAQKLSCDNDRGCINIILAGTGPSNPTCIDATHGVPVVVGGTTQTPGGMLMACENPMFPYATAFGSLSCSLNYPLACSVGFYPVAAPADVTPTCSAGFVGGYTCAPTGDVVSLVSNIGLLGNDHSFEMIPLGASQSLLAPSSMDWSFGPTTGVTSLKASDGKQSAVIVNSGWINTTWSSLVPGDFYVLSVDFFINNADFSIAVFIYNLYHSK